ncbi:Helicase [Ectocarpus siliculosus]|uniref:Helicase n=1 Tax=Ectocarpus siliculosus TaxID=2880 RepID=D8LP58_ECTSI|nr:Helicase [Ectocarpus siliculosus]|eukprot:CBN80329.1 Helicase [Ectocarpus siliculosus]
MTVSQNYENDLAMAVAIAMKKSGITFAPSPISAEKDTKKNSIKEAEAKKKKIARQMLRLQEDLVSSQKRVGVGGVVGRSGRPRAKRVRYDPSAEKKRVRPSKPAPKMLNPTRSTVDDRVDTARTRALGRKQETEKRNQCNVIEFMKRVADPTKNKEKQYANTKGLLIAHGMGSGKTLTSLWVAKEYIAKNRVKFVNILAPNVAVGEFIDSFERAGITPQIAGKIRVLTHDEFALNKKAREFSKSLVIVDEAHMFTGIKYDALAKADVSYLMLLSGTPAPNAPSEIVPLINLLYRKKKDNWTKQKWDKSTTTSSEKKKFLRDKVSMYNIGPKYNYLRKRGTEFHSANKFPGYKVSMRNVKLSPSQNAAYVKLNKTVKKESPGQREKHPFYARERKIVNTHPKRQKGRVTPKVAKVASDVVRDIKKSHSRKQSKHDPDRLSRGRLLLYAYHKDTIADLEGEIRRLCDEKNIVSPQISTYNGDTSAGERMRIKQAFNNGEMDLLIISKAGSVGLDLQCTSKVFMFDLWWNIPQMNQVIGRAIRFKSHHEPCKHKHVDVYVYQSVFVTKQDKGVKVFDAQVLLDAVKKWTKVSHMIENVMKPASIKNAASCDK